MAFEHYDKCSLLLPMDGVNNGTTFTDWSPNPKTVTRFGDTKTVTSTYKYYGSSGYFDGTGDYLSVPDSNEFELGSSDFTLAAWINVNGYPNNNNGSYLESIVTKDVSTSRGFSLNLEGSASAITTFGFLGCSDNTTGYTKVSGSYAFNLNQWYHVVACRNGNNVYLFVDGVLINSGSSAFTRTIQDSTTTLKVGANEYDANYKYYFKGHIQDLIIIKGAALWTSNFTPPTRLIGEISGTVKDSTDTAAARTIIAVPRSNPTRVFATTSSAVDGSYTLRVPATEVSRIALANEATLYNDIVDRIIPE